MYGLKQIPWAWFGRFAKVMIIVYYKQSHGDHTLFVKHSALEGVITLLVHVDDIIVTENDLEERKTLKWCLARSWKTKEFLGN